ncbi:hypothetical protein BGZ97_008538 [Linnemannia gamsii]|jgi:hypothetical protein|uniref:Uncharacterized protein n=1 Tax=Linnemannia gamsii TaxID=64522 RepID=A0A9P6QPE7_9FUNG|nr:hypothetical protein BGZ97_008538 [Linnemannia gamsii]
MKIQFLTIAALALATSTVSAYECKGLQIAKRVCMEDMFEAAHCNCIAYEKIEIGSCYHKCSSTNPHNSCITGCGSLLSKGLDACRKKYDYYKENGGGIHWIAEMGVEKAEWCISG